HAILVPGAWRVHHASRGAALDRPVPDDRAREVRRAAAGAPADRSRGAAGRATVSVPAAAGGERGPTWAVTQARHGYGQHRGPGRRCRVPTHGRGRRGGHGPVGARRLLGRRVDADRVLERGRGRFGPARRAEQRRRSAAIGLRRRVRAGRRDGAGRGDEGEHADTEVPPGRARAERGMTDDLQVTPPYLRVLAVDDEPPALDELAYLL